MKTHCKLLIALCLMLLNLSVDALAQSYDSTQYNPDPAKRIPLA